MVRNYAPDPVSREAVERIVGTVRRAPSAGYSQGQRLLVVMEDEGRAELVRIASAGWGVEEGLEPWLESAPVHVLVCTREDDYHERYRQEDKLVDGEEIEWPVPFWYMDAGAARHAHPARGDRRGARGRAHRRAEGAGAPSSEPRSASRTT